MGHDDIQSGIAKAGIAGARFHLFICIGPDCCGTNEGLRTWDYVKQRIKDTGIRAMRTKAACFRICSGGPWLVVYPDGIWYGHLTPVRFERILQEHLLRGQPVEKWITARNPLGTPQTPAAPVIPEDFP